MFDTALSTLSQELTDLTNVVDWQNKLRDTIFPQANQASPFAVEAPTLAILQAAAPSKLTWRLIDHCAAIGRIYAAFELSIIELVEEYAAIAPRVFPQYSDLHEDLRTNYRVGIGHVLSKWSANHSAYGQVAENAIAAGLADGLRGSSYTLLPDAFLTDSDNYRPDTLNRVFRRIGFADAYSTVSKNPEIDDFCTNSLFGSHTAESYLTKLVRDRNDAAHGNVSQVAAIGELRNYAKFTYLVASALATMLRTRLVKSGLTSGVSSAVGEVLLAYSNNIVGVRSCGNGAIQIGQKVFCGKKSLEGATVLSIQQEKNTLHQLQLVAGTEFGLRLDRKLSVGAQLFTSTL
jgi:hypothetical protein